MTALVTAPQQHQGTYGRRHGRHYAGIGSVTLGALAMLLLGLNLRPAITSAGSMLAVIVERTGMTGAQASMLVAIPVWCLAAGGKLTWRLRLWWGTYRSVMAALYILAFSLLVRTFGGPWVLLAATVSACSAIAVLTVLLPPIARAAPPQHQKRLTSCYAVSLGIGSGLGTLTPALANLSSWHAACSVWALLTAAAVLAWQAWSDDIAHRADGSLGGRRRRVGRFSLQPAKTAWTLTLHSGLTLTFSMCMMGWLPTLLGDCGVYRRQAGWMFALAMCIGIPVAIRVGTWVQRHNDQSVLVQLFALFNLFGTVGLIFTTAPGPALWVYSGTIGLGMPSIVLALQLLQLRGGNTDDTAALSSRVYGVGFGIAGIVTFAIGQLHTLSGSWRLPLIALLAVLAGAAMSGTTAGRPATVRITPRGQSLCQVSNSSAANGSTAARTNSSSTRTPTTVR
jgi:CP family cyanate transporter-like MFS transporter